MLVSDQVFSKIGNVTHDNEEIVVMIKWLNHQEDLPNFKASNRASKYMMQKLS